MNFYIIANSNTVFEVLVGQWKKKQNVIGFIVKMVNQIESLLW